MTDVPPPTAPSPTAPSPTALPPTAQMAERAKGYKPWAGERGAQRFPWWVIARGNLQLAWANRWVKLILLLSLVPGVVASGIVYFIVPLSSLVLITLFQTSVAFIFLLSALVGARLISEDRKQGAFIAHFARPVRRIDYLVGKFLALAAPIFLIAAVSPMFAIAADASVDNETLAKRLNLQNVPGGGSGPFAGYLAHVAPGPALTATITFGLVAALTTTGLVLGISALTTSTRTAGLAWFAIVALGGAAKNVLEAATHAQWPALLSWTDALSDLAAWIAGRTPDSSMEFVPWGRLTLLAALSVAGLVFVDLRLRGAEGGAR